MLSIRLDKELENKLETIAKETKKPKSFFVKEALKEYLQKLESKRLKNKKEAFEYFLNNPVDTGISDLKAIQKVKSEKDIH
jgi:metal-responsive CopG/Arc/MetJ family transcriptional regulator